MKRLRPGGNRHDGRMFKILQVCASLIAVSGNVFAIANWARGEGVLMWEYIGWPEYVTAIFFCTASIVAINWGLVLHWREKRRSNRPETQFTQLYECIKQELEATTKWDGSLRARSIGQKIADRQTLALALENLGIDAPEVNQDDEWSKFVTWLCPLAIHGRLEKAKRLLEAIYAEAVYEDDK